MGWGDGDGADDRNRTYNLLITNQLLCQLSYVSMIREQMLSQDGVVCQAQDAGGAAVAGGRKGGKNGTQRG